MPRSFLTLILLQFWNCSPGDWRADPSESVQLRLVNGGSRCAGRLEVRYKGRWGTVFDNTWDLQDADVVCRELGCGIARAAPPRSYFGEGSGSVVTGNVRCRGSEAALRECASATWKRYRRVHSNDAGVICGEPRKLRLVNGSSSCGGRLEVYMSGSWRTICGDMSWSRAIGDRVCEELGCGYRTEVSLAVHFGNGLGPVIGPPKCRHQRDIEVICSDYRILRLESGMSRCSGRVKIRQGSAWATLCDTHFDLEDAAVVCEHLQCGTVAAIPRADYFGKGAGPFWKQKYMCRGNESQLWDCPISSWEQFNCSHGSDARVNCSDESWTPRLTNGGSRCDGTVEVYQNRRWGRVKDNLWDLNDANVVCRELGCGYAKSVYDSSKYGESDGPVLVNGVHCNGNELHLRNCNLTTTPLPVSSSGVGVLCSEHLKIRLADGASPCAGRVEVYYNGTWGSVCDDSWDVADAAVVCRQLGCGSVVITNHCDDCGQSSGQIWLDEVACLGNESFLWQCPSAQWGEHDCAHKEDVLLMCSEHKEIRLENGKHRCEGRVEVFYNGSWGTVCGENLDPIAAEVICKQLQCGALQGIRYDIQEFGPGSGPIWLDGVVCMSHELSLWQCQANPWSENNCQHSKDVGVICSGTTALRRSQSSKDCFGESCATYGHSSESGQQLHLVGGNNNCSGRVEILLNNSWATVCDDSWDMADAHVVCRQSGCGSAQSAPGGGAFGQGGGVIWEDELKCKGSESFLSDCRSAQPGTHNCNHKEDAGVICSGMGLSLTGSSSLRFVGSIPVAVCIVMTFLFAFLFVALVVVTRRKSARRDVATGGWGSPADFYQAVYEEIDNTVDIDRFIQPSGSGSFPDISDDAEPGDIETHGGEITEGDLSKLECTPRARKDPDIPVTNIQRGNDDLHFELAHPAADRQRLIK